MSVTPPPVEYFIEKIPPENRRRRVREIIEVAQIAEKMVHWENIAPYLGLKETEVEAVKHNNKNYEEQK